MARLEERLGVLPPLEPVHDREEEEERIPLLLRDAGVPEAHDEHVAVPPGGVLGRVQVGGVEDQGLALAPARSVLPDGERAPGRVQPEAHVRREDEVHVVAVQADGRARRHPREEDLINNNNN